MDSLFLLPTHAYTNPPHPARTPGSLPCCFYTNFILTCIFTENGTEITGLEYLEVITVPYFKHLDTQILSSRSRYIIYTPGLQSNTSNQGGQRQEDPGESSMNAMKKKSTSDRELKPQFTVSRLSLSLSLEVSPAEVGGRVKKCHGGEGP